MILGHQQQLSQVSIAQLIQYIDTAKGFADRNHERTKGGRGGQNGHGRQDDVVALVVVAADNDRPNAITKVVTTIVTNVKI